MRRRLNPKAPPSVQIVVGNGKTSRQTKQEVGANIAVRSRIYWMIAPELWIPSCLGGLVGGLVGVFVAGSTYTPLSGAVLGAIVGLVTAILFVVIVLLLGKALHAVGFESEHAIGFLDAHLSPRGRWVLLMGAGVHPSAQRRFIATSLTYGLLSQVEATSAHTRVWCLAPLHPASWRAAWRMNGRTVATVLDAEEARHRQSAA